MRKHITISTAHIIILFLIVDDFCIRLFATVWFNRSLFRFMHYAVSFHLPMALFILYLLRQNRIVFYFEKLAEFTTVLLPSLGVIGFSLMMWRFDTVLNYQTQLLGYNWQWLSIFLWQTLFISLVFLYSRAHIANLHALAMAFFSIHLASILYELPWNFSRGVWLFLIQPKFFVSLIGLILILGLYGWRPSKWILLTLLPVVVSWLFFWSLPYGFSWFPRLSTFPFFLSLAFGFKSKVRTALMNRLRALQNAGSWSGVASFILITLLCGFVHALRYGLHPGYFVVWICYFLGSLGIWSLLKSVEVKDPGKRISLFAVSFICCLVAWVSLEVLL